MEDIVDTLLQSFRRVPPAAVPAMLDCILASTGSYPSSLFSYLLNAFPSRTKEIVKDSEKLEYEQCNFIGSYVDALCHLVKKSGATPSYLRSLIWRVVLPLMNLVHAYDREMLNKVAGSFLDAVVETNSWGIVEVTLVPFFMRLLGLSMGLAQSEELAIYRWTRYPVFSEGSDDQLTDSKNFQGYNDQSSDLDLNGGSVLSQFGYFPVPISCHILILILNAAIRNNHPGGSTCGLILANGCCPEIFAGNFLWDLCNTTIRMLSQSLEHRSCAISCLLPFIFKAFVSDRAFEVSVHGQTYILSRKHLFFKTWKCCRTLFSLGPLERRDAYAVLSLYSSFFSYTDGCSDANISGKEEAFDLRDETELWEELRRGLGDKEGLVRKQSLHILKMMVRTSEENQCSAGVPETIASGKNSTAHGMTKRERWADKEAESLGVGKICNSEGICLNGQKKWAAFFLLYEMLEEYGTHLVEAAWNHQITLMLHSSFPSDNYVNSISRGVYPSQMETLAEIFKWLAVLWERGFCHDNPQVRCLIMQSFLDIEWKKYENLSKLVPEDFVIGPFVQGLNDPVHHKDFGVKGVYSSRTIEGATKFIFQYSSYLNVRKQVSFLSNLASFAKKHSLGRPGLMGLAGCTASAACGVRTQNNNEVERCKDASPADLVQVKSGQESSSDNDKADLLDILRFIIESSKQHFNHNYRCQVCEKIVEAAASVMSVCDVPLEILLNFIATLPREFTDCGGLLRPKVQKWLSGYDEKHASICRGSMQLLKSLSDFPRNFLNHHHSVDIFATYDDEDLDAWSFKADRWVRVLFLAVTEEQHLDPILMFIQNDGVDFSKSNSHSTSAPLKFLILVLSLVHELEVMQEKTTDGGMKGRTKSHLCLSETVSQSSFIETSIIFERFSKMLLSILKELVIFAKISCSIFWSDMAMQDAVLPGSIKGKLGGPSQRRLSSTTTTTVLQAITSVKTVASICRWCAQFGSDVMVDSALTFLWKTSWKVIISSTCTSETEAEVLLAAYEALAYVLKTLASVFSPLALDLIMENDKSSPPEADCKPLLDFFVQNFVQNINNLIAVGSLARSRRAILMNWKWICLESLLSIPNYARENGVYSESCNSFFSNGRVRWIFGDLVDSLENAGEDSVLPMLRSVRLILELFASGRISSVVSSCDGVYAQMMWQLVHSSWILHVSCNKRRVAPIAAILSSVLHCSVFSDESMHEINYAPGPLKWFVEEILEEGTKSPRTIRISALHLTGSWLANPSTIKYYMKELKLLTMYGSVAFDEDFEAELAENHDARSEILLLAKTPDPELIEEFINTELYARVSVAVFFYKLADLADMVGSISESKISRTALESGKMFLLELLDYAVNDKDLSKELYKKYSAIHRRKIRAWQMICILSRFIDEDIVQKVTSSLHISLHRNNLPGVRQYLETCAIHIYLKFPSLVQEQLVPLLRNYDMKPQALSSYVFIAANVILHATELLQSRHLDELLPAIIPLLTSHHHTLRGFTQLLVYQVLHKLLPAMDSSPSGTLSLEKRCFEDLKSYLTDNSDCARLRSSMEGYLSDFDPKNSIAPAGIFSNRVEEVEFECVPTSLMERVIIFLNEAREDLRCSMAKDAATLKNESLQIDENPNCTGISVNSNKEELLFQLPKHISLDFQKKVTFSKHERRGADSGFFLGNNDTYRSLMDMEKEDQLLDLLLHSSSVAMEELKASRQQFILVASLLDRIPNLAGLARTCEVFKAAGLAIADTNILHDKQFQLISVTADKWVPVLEVPVSSLTVFLEKKKQEGFAILGLEQTANSIPLDQYNFPKKTVLVLGREKEGIPVEIIHILDTCIEIPQLGVVRSLNVHVSGAIALWEYTRQHRSH